MVVSRHRADAVERSRALLTVVRTGEVPEAERPSSRAVLCRGRNAGHGLDARFFRRGRSLATVGQRAPVVKVSPCQTLQGRRLRETFLLFTGLSRVTPR